MTAPDRLKGAAAGVGLLGVVVAVPVILYGFGGGLPTRLPSADQVHHFVGQPITDTAVLRGVSLIAWALWALFVAAVAVEAVAYARHRPSPGHDNRGLRIPGLQGAAAALFLTVTLLLPDQRAAKTIPTSAGALYSTRAPVTATLTSAQTATSRTDSTATAAGTTRAAAGVDAGRIPYTVVRYDSPWAIAQTHLGSGLRWKEITTSNGQSLILPGERPADVHGTWTEETNYRTIYPGQVLLLPPDATGVPAPPAATVTPPAPTTPAPASAPTATPTHPAPTTSPQSRSTVPTPPTTIPRPASTAPPKPAATAPRSVSRPPAANHSGAVDAHHPHRATIVSLSSELAGAGVLSAGLILLLTKLALVANGKRRRGRRTHRPSAEGARVELAARIGADFDTLDIVDLGCRFLASQLAGGPPPPAVVAVEATPDWLAILLGETVTDAPDGFTVGADGQSWILEQPDRLYAVADQLDEIVPPLPALVSLGRTTDGITILINLGALGLISIEGDPQMAAEAVTAAAIELATVPWSQAAQVILVGFGRADGLGVAEPVTLVDTLDECLEQLRTSAAALQTAAGAEGVSLDQLRLTGNPVDLDPTIVVCLQPIGDEALAGLAQLAAIPASGLAAVVVAGRAPGGWTLEIDDDGLLDVTPLARTVDAQRIPLPLFDAIEERFAAAADTADYPANTARRWPDAADHMTPSELLPVDDTDLTDPAPADDLADPETMPVDAGADRQLEDASDHPSSNDAPAVSAPLTPLATPHPLHAPGRSGPHPPLAVADPPPDILVQVLTSSPQVLRRCGDHYEPVTVSRARALEAVVYLACHPNGVTSTRLAAALQPELTTGRVPADRTNTFSTVMSTARKALGADSNGELYLPPKTAERFRLSPQVMLDWHLLLRLHQRASTTAQIPARIQLLSEALALVGDEAPFAEIRRLGRRQRANQRNEHWRWFQVEFLTDVEQNVTDVASELAELHQHAQNPLAASAAARKGLQTSPLDRTLRTVHLSAEAARGPAHLQSAWEDVQRVFENEAEPYDHVDDDLRRHYQDLLADTG
jgi:hypothetical protein